MFTFPGQIQNMNVNYPAGGQPAPQIFYPARLQTNQVVNPTHIIPSQALGAPPPQIVSPPGLEARVQSIEARLQSFEARLWSIEGRLGGLEDAMRNLVVRMDDFFQTNGRPLEQARPV